MSAVSRQAPTVPWPWAVHCRRLPVSLCVCGGVAVFGFPALLRCGTNLSNLAQAQGPEIGPNKQHASAQPTAVLLSRCHMLLVCLWEQRAAPGRARRGGLSEVQKPKGDAKRK